MKTHKNSHTTTPAGTLPQPEQATPDTKQRQLFKATLILAQRSSGRILIEAANLQEAEKKAAKTEMDEVHDWEAFEDELSVEAVELITGGNRDE